MTAQRTKTYPTVTRRQSRTKYPGKETQRSVALTQFASDKLNARDGEYRYLSVSDTVEQLIREHLTTAPVVDGLAMEGDNV